MDRNALQQLLAQGVSVEQIGRRFGKHPSTVSYWMRKHGLVAPNRAKHAPKGGIEREGLTEMVMRGMTIAEIAVEVGRSKGTVRHWMRRFGLESQNSRGARGTGVAREALATGPTTIAMECRWHGETEFVLEGRGSYRCKRCRTERVVNHRRKVKAVLVAEAGGRCRVCGYDKYLGALQFHHIEPATKRLGIAYKGSARALETMRAEAAKCVLLCSNCHAEVEGGATRLALKYAQPAARAGLPSNTP